MEVLRQRHDEAQASDRFVGRILQLHYLNGRIVKIALAQEVTDWSEADLAEEIVAMATLARKQGLTAQHSFTAAFMRQLGHDPAATHYQDDH